MQFLRGMMKVSALVLFHFAVTSALNWSSAGVLPNGTTVPACPGQDVTLAWSYTATPEDHLTNVEWHFNPPGGSDVVLATQVMGSFFSAPGMRQHVQFIPNAGIRLLNVDVADAGTYSVHVNVEVHGSLVKNEQSVEVYVSDQPLTTDGQLHVAMLPDAVYDSDSQQFHVQLSCGQFKLVWSSRVAVVWKTPSEETLPSTSYDNGRFLLSLPNPVASGEYTCALDSTSPASLCVKDGTPIKRGSTVNVDGVQAQLVVINAQMTAMRQKEGQMDTLLHNYQTLLNSYEQKNAVLETLLNTTHHKNAALETSLRDHQTLLNSVQEENAALKQQMVAVQNNLTLVMDKNSKRAMFFARLTATIQVTSLNHIILATVLVNDGNAYSATTSEFTVPYDGYYSFTATAASYYTSTAHYPANLNIMVDSSALSYLYAQSVDYYEQASCNYASHLRRGQKVWLRANGNGYFYSTLTTFSGFLVSAD